MHTGDLVVKYVTEGYINPGYGIILKTVKKRGYTVCVVMWENGDIAHPFMKDLKVIHESR